ncbi:MAG TPA: DsbA family oxidoreductase [Labilithrix sp.]
MEKLRVDVWSDLVCPWCAIGKRRFQTALARFDHEVELVWHAFELDPSAPASRVEDNASRLAHKYGMSRDDAVERMEQLRETAAHEGLTFDLVHARSGNTFDAHRVLKLARTHGVEDVVVERLFRGYMSERKAIGDPETLVELASDAGLDAEEVRATLAGDRFADEVRADEELARRIGISGVPFFVMGGVLGVSGAQSPEVFVRALAQAWERAQPESLRAPA